MTTMQSEGPELSVIVIAMDGNDALRACLIALAEQVDAPSIEVIVPVDHVSSDATGLATEFPDVDFLELGETAGGQTPNDPMEFYHIWTIRRAAGIDVARGRLVGMLTDRGLPAPDWATQMLDLQKKHDAAAVGGCTENGIDTTWHWAVHFYDFARYMPPQPTSEADHISVTNAVYDAAALDKVAATKGGQFFELAVHEALAASERPVILSDLPLATELRPRIPTSELLREWFTWGRKYAGFRVAEISTRLRLLRILSAPAVPFVLYLRQLGVQRKKEVHMTHFWRASPLLLLIVTMWALGELVGYCLGPKKDLA